MQSQNSFFDDLSKVTTGAMGTMAGMAREFEGQARERFRDWVGGLDMVSRDEFEAVKAIAVAARDEAAALRVELAAIKGSRASVATPETPTPDVPSPDAAAAAGGAGPDGQPQA